MPIVSSPIYGGVVVDDGSVINLCRSLNYILLTARGFDGRLFFFIFSLIANNDAFSSIRIVKGRRISFLFRRKRSILSKLLNFP